MQPLVQPPIQGQIALKQGVLYGVAIVVINIILAYVSHVTTVGAIVLITYLVALGGYFWVGLATSKLTGRVLTGLLAGLYAGIIGGIGYLVWSLINIYVLAPQSLSNINVPNSTLSSSQVQTLANIGVVIGLILAVIVNVAIGLGLGAAGGAIGKGSAKVPVVEYNPYPAPPSQE